MSLDTRKVPSIKCYLQNLHSEYNTRIKKKEKNLILCLKQKWGPFFDYEPEITIITTILSVISLWMSSSVYRCPFCFDVEGLRVRLQSADGAADINFAFISINIIGIIKWNINDQNSSIKFGWRRHIHFSSSNNDILHSKERRGS